MSPRRRARPTTRTRVLLREAREGRAGPPDELPGEAEQAWWEDADGNRERMTVGDYNAERFDPRMAHAARGKPFETPSGYLEEDTVHVLANGEQWLCLYAQRSMAEADDLIQLPEDWRSGTHVVRPGVRIVDGYLEQDRQRLPADVGVALAPAGTLRALDYVGAVVAPDDDEVLMLIGGRRP